MKTLLLALRILTRSFGFDMIRSKNVKLPPQNQLTIEITMRTGTPKYQLDQYQRLNNTLLKSIVVPYGTTMPNNTGTAMLKSPTNKDIVDIEIPLNCYITLNNTRSEAILDNVPLTRYILDQNKLKDKHEFNEQDIDWTKSFIYFPDQTMVDAENGNSLLIVVGFEDYYRVAEAEKLDANFFERLFR